MLGLEFEIFNLIIIFFFSYHLNQTLDDFCIQIKKIIPKFESLKNRKGTFWQSPIEAETEQEER